jgi:phenylacetate-CoA ligase
VTRKPELLERAEWRSAPATPSAASPPSAGAACAGCAARRVYQSPGPIYEPEGAARGLLAHRARALYAAGFRAGDLRAQQLQRTT